MPFDKELARKIANGSDRNVARYFAGRAAEIASFEQALDDASLETQTVFRVYMGAPGCGKSSLMRHIREQADPNGNVLFASVGRAALASKAVLWTEVVDAALKRKLPRQADEAKLRAFWREHGAGVVRGAGEMVRIKQAGAALRRWQEGMALDRLTVVAQFDEAQNLNRRQLATLEELHAEGLGVPSVAMLAGLSHTSDALSDARISRSGAHADVLMGCLSDEECAESTLAMLDEVQPDGTGAERIQLAECASRLAHGWPQHLNRAQAITCAELLRADGRIRAVSMHNIEAGTKTERAAYYEGRLDDRRLFGGDDELVQHIILAVDRSVVETNAELADVCDTQIKALRRDKHAHFRLAAEGVADGLVKKGVVQRTKRKRFYEVPIPSMVTWARERIRERSRVGLSR